MTTEGPMKPCDFDIEWVSIADMQNQAAEIANEKVKEMALCSEGMEDFDYEHVLDLQTNGKSVCAYCGKKLVLLAVE